MRPHGWRDPHPRRFGRGRRAFSSPRGFFLAYYVQRRLRRLIFAWFMGALALGGLASYAMYTHVGGAWRPHLAALTGLVVVWGAAGVASWKLARPMDELVRAAEALGRGDLAARVDLHRARHGEARILGVTFNEMADRIEGQLRDQRALLALVSHEIRTPLARMRLLAERVEHPDAATRAGAAAAMDQEIAELDALVSDLLASSRIDFLAAQHIALSPIEIATRAVEAARLDPTVLEVEGKPQAFTGDATLVVRAVVNLLENAKKHGGAGLALHVEERDGFITFQVDDDGPGLAPGEEARVFEPFYRAVAADADRPDAHARSVGLGLSLVQRIALAHGGWVSAGPRDAGVAGARFIIAFPCASP